MLTDLKHLFIIIFCLMASWFLIKELFRELKNSFIEVFVNGSCNYTDETRNCHDNFSHRKIYDDDLQSDINIIDSNDQLKF